MTIGGRSGRMGPPQGIPTTGLRTGSGQSSSITTSSTGARRRAPSPGVVAIPSRDQSQNFPNGEIAPGIPRLKLTEEEELEILEKMESGNYITGAGLAQFLPGYLGPSASVEPISKPKFQQNLLGAFASLDKEDNVVCKVDDATGKLKDMQLEKDESSEFKLDGYEIPSHCKKLDELAATVNKYKKLMEDTVEAVFEARFAELFPVELLQAVKKMESAAAILESFMNENPSENMMLFLPNQNKEEIPVLPCPVEEQEEVVEIIHSLSELLEKFQRYLNSQKVRDAINLPKMVQGYVDVVEKFEKDLKNGKDNLAAAEELYDFFRLHSSNDSSESSGISLDASP